MHELGLTLHVLDIVADAAQKNSVSKVNSIRLKIGAYSGVVPELITECFKSAGKGTVAEGASLSFEEVPVTVSCRNCGRTGELRKHEFTCPYCGSDDIKLETGREFYIDSIEVNG